MDPDRLQKNVGFKRLDWFLAFATNEEHVIRCMDEVKVSRKWGLSVRDRKRVRERA